MEFAETVYRQEERPDLPVSFLMVLHALRLECEKSMELTASSPRSCIFCSSRDSSDEVALSVSVLTGSQVSDEGAIEGATLFVPAWHIVLLTATWDTLFGRG